MAFAVHDPADEDLGGHGAARHLIRPSKCQAVVASVGQYRTALHAGSLSPPQVVVRTALTPTAEELRIRA